MTEDIERILPDLMPDELPGFSEHPAPWRSKSLGNGHFAVWDRDGEYIGHVYCWSKKDFKTFKSRIGCQEHPDYKAFRSPAVDCDLCWLYYNGIRQLPLDNRKPESSS